MKKTFRADLSIQQNILLFTLIIVTSVLMVTTFFYYKSFTGRSDSLIAGQSREINKQIVTNYEVYITSVIETANYIQTALFNRDINQNRATLNQLFQNNSDIKQDVASIYLFDKQGNLLLKSNQDSNIFHDITEQSWLQNAWADPNIFHFSQPHNNSLSQGREEQIISVTKEVEYSSGGILNQGVLLIELNFSSITNLSEKTNLGQGGHILILNDKNSLIYSSESSALLTDLTQSAATKQILGGSKIQIQSQEMFLYINTLANTRWRIVTLSNINEILQARKDMISNLFLIFAASFIITALVAAWLSSRISRPLNQLQNQMQRIENGEFELVTETVQGQKEIVRVSHTFNSMIAEIRSLMARVVEEQRSKRKTELVALQNQINPHFLYNTLDSIVWLAEHKRTKEVITMVVSLARFFRISISRGENLIPLKEELEHVRNYLTIQKIRYADRFEYSVEAEESILRYPVMKLILQPLVENAIYHGIGDELERISIRCSKKSNLLYLQVENSGLGITEEKIRELTLRIRDSQAGKSIGLRNVYQRLQLYHGEDSDLIIESELDKMTRITLMIPIEEQDL